ncbi:MAG: type II toxin-antitoxin system prevent-host-death family antitoxin [Deinococcota bacterium]
MSNSISLDETQVTLADILKQVAQGDEVVILQAGTPVAKVVPATELPARRPGGAEGLEVPDTFFEALPADIQDHFQ